MFCHDYSLFLTIGKTATVVLLVGKSEEYGHHHSGFTLLTVQICTELVRLTTADRLEIRGSRHLLPLQPRQLECGQTIVCFIIWFHGALVSFTTRR